MKRATPEDLLKTVIEADDRRRRAKGQPSTRAALSLVRSGPSRERRFLEALFNGLGHGWAFVMAAMPSPIRRPFVQWVNAKMGGYTPETNPFLPAHIQETVRAAEEIKERTGEWPALVVMTSHPDTEGSHQWLRFEILRQGLQIADAVVEARDPGAWYPVHPRCFLAIDPFALDTVSTPVGGFYAAWMHQIYVAWDRQASSQSWFQKNIFLHRSGYGHIAWKLLRLLKSDTPVLMAMGGGLPYNARLLYTAREFVHRLRMRRWNVAKRQAQIDLMRILMEPEGTLWPAEQGEIPAPHAESIRQAMKAWGLEPDRVELALAELRAEFKFPVPYRERLFRVLANRLVARGKPVLLVGISHSETAPHVRIGAPVAFDTIPEDLTSFAQRFVRDHF